MEVNPETDRQDSDERGDVHRARLSRVHIEIRARQPAPEPHAPERCIMMRGALDVEAGMGVQIPLLARGER